MNTPNLTKPLKGVRILSLALNLPGPAALMRCREMGASCFKLEPPAAAAATSGDPMSVYNPAAYAAMHKGIRISVADLKTAAGQKTLHRQLAKTDVLLTSFRPSALIKLGLDWVKLQQQYPQLSMVAIVGSHGRRAEEPGHDLTYLAENDLLTGFDMPATLYADMGGSLQTSEAVLKAMFCRAVQGKGVFQEVSLAAAAAWLALPRYWGLTQAGAALAGTHAGYRIYPCSDGRVAMAALEPHFAARLCAVTGIQTTDADMMLRPEVHQAIAAFLLPQTCEQIRVWADARDIPLQALLNK